MTELEFKSLAAQGYNRIPLIAEALADLETPLSLYLKLAQQSTLWLAGYALLGILTVACAVALLRVSGRVGESESGRVKAQERSSSPTAGKKRLSVPTPSTTPASRQARAGNSLPALAGPTGPRRPSGAPWPG